jgi:hypothetical protein
MPSPHPKPKTGGFFRPGHPFWPDRAMMTIILLLLGLVCFYLFFVAIDYFEKI